MRRSVSLAVALVVMGSAPGCARPPSIAQSHRNAVSAYERSDYTAAIGYWDVVLEQNREEDRAHYGQGISYLALAEDAYTEQGNPVLALLNLDKADFHLQAAIQSNPGHPHAQQALATSLRRRGRYEQALSVAQFSATASWPEARRHVFLGKERERAGDVDAAIVAYRQAIAVEPASPEGYQALADLYAAINDPGSAAQYWAEAAARRPK